MAWADGLTDEERQARWEAESDARTLAESEVIRGDEKRMGRAQDAAARLAKEAKEQADAMADVAKVYSKSEMPPKKEGY